MNKKIVGLLVLSCVCAGSAAAFAQDGSGQVFKRTDPEKARIDNLYEQGKITAQQREEMLDKAALKAKEEEKQMLKEKKNAAKEDAKEAKSKAAAEYQEDKRFLKGKKNAAKEDLKDAKDEAVSEARGEKKAVRGKGNAFKEKAKEFDAPDAPPAGPTAVPSEPGGALNPLPGQSVLPGPGK